MFGETTPRVLVADDDSAIRQLLCTIIRREHMEVDCVGDGTEAIARLEEQSYSVILLDLMMPRVSGFEVIEYLKKNPPAIKPVVLVISAYADQRVRGVDASIVSGILRKPFEVADLGGIVSGCIHGLDREIFDTSDRAAADAAHAPN